MNIKKGDIVQLKELISEKEKKVLTGKYMRVDLVSINNITAIFDNFICEKEKNKFKKCNFSEREIIELVRSGELKN